MNERVDLNLRSIIDGIALQVSDHGDSEDLQTLIADRTVEYVSDLREQHSWLTEAEINRVAEAIITGVLKRLAQIAEGGGQIGSA
jgi:hypothetical protein